MDVCDFVRNVDDTKILLRLHFKILFNIIFMLLKRPTICAYELSSWV